MRNISNCVETLSISNTITDCKVNRNKIEITTGSGEILKLNNTKTCVNILNGIIGTQRLYQTINEKKVIEEKINLNKKSIVLMTFFLLISITLLMLLTNIITSIMFLLFLTMQTSSLFNHLYLKRKLKEQNNILNCKQIIKFEEVPQEEEILYLEDEENGNKLA